jgi:hypothetical protein
MKDVVQIIAALKVFGNDRTDLWATGRAIVGTWQL